MAIIIIKTIIFQNQQTNNNFRTISTKVIRKMNDSQQMDYIYISSDDEEEGNRKIITSTQQKINETPKWEYNSASTIRMDSNEWKRHMDESSINWSEIFRSSSKEVLAEPFCEIHDVTNNSSMGSEKEQENGRFLNSNKHEMREEMILSNKTTNNNEGMIIKETKAWKEVMEWDLSREEMKEKESITKKKEKGEIHNFSRNKSWEIFF